MEEEEFVENEFEEKSRPRFFLSFDYVLTTPKTHLFPHSVSFTHHTTHATTIPTPTIPPTTPTTPTTV